MRDCSEKSILAKQINDSIYVSPCTNSLEYIVVLSDLFVSIYSLFLLTILIHI